MAERWTPEQMEAITQKDCNLLVAAAAGAGKTAVLVERIIKKITDENNPSDIDRLLVVTFTNAAATEMRERIGSALAEALETNPSSANLQKQMALLDRASIMTLHSFCLEVVRNHFHSLDLDPLFRIADETECALMKLDVMDELFEDKYENENADSIFFHLVESCGGGHDDSQLRETVLALHNFTRSHPWPEQWLAAQAEAYSLGASACLSSTPWAHVLLKSAAAELQGLAALLEKAAALASRSMGLEPYCGVLEEDLEKLRGLLSLCRKAESTAAAMQKNARANDAFNTNNESIGGTEEAFPGTCDKNVITANGSDDGADAAWDALHSAFASFKLSKLPRCGKNADTAAQEAVKAARNHVKESVKKLYESGFNAESREIKEDLRKLYPQLKYLSQLVCEFENRYRQKKKDKGILDFSDLEHYCLKVLLEGGKPTAAANELSKRYDEILVDEYQDSNLIQELIINTVSGNRYGRRNIFMVGDVKQSIYRFRQARPELFMSKYTTYPHESGHENRVIQLYKNFRSRKEIVNGVNFIFKQVMSELVGELDYTENEYLNPGAEFEEPDSGCFAGGPIEVHIVDVTSRANEITSWDDSASGDATDTGHESRDAADTSRESRDTADIDRKSRDAASGSKAAGNPAGSDSPDEGNSNDGEYEEESLDSIQAEARIVGKRIKELVSGEAGRFYIFDKKAGSERSENPAATGVYQESEELEESLKKSEESKKPYKYRPVEYRDIVILMRTTRNWADVFSDELAAMGIPAYADTGIGYFKTVEVETMLSLLQIIDNPFQDIPMLAVLRSPIGGFSTDDLADIRLADRSASIYEAMKIIAGNQYGGPDRTGTNDAGTAGTKNSRGSETADGGPADGGTKDGIAADSETTDGEMSGMETIDAQMPAETADIGSSVQKKTREFLERLQAWRDASQYLPTDELVWKLMNETGYYSYVGILPGGPERQANLRMLFERARQFEETSYRGLFNFVNFINRLKSGGEDMGSAKILGENDNVVRIMSIHKSKGLEFPVVIIAGCGKKFNMTDLNAGILLHQELGFGPDLVDLAKRTITPTMPKFAIRQKLRLETLSEEMRILYVAFTRAREKLIITGSVKDAKKACAGWCNAAARAEAMAEASASAARAADEKLSTYDIMQASSYLDWIGPAIARHESCDAIRRASNSPEDIKCLPDISCWEIRFWGTGAAEIRKEAAAANENVKKWLESAESDGLDGRNSGRYSPQSEKYIKALEWQYPYLKLSGIPVKISVTELKRRFMQEEQADSAVPYVQSMVEKPVFMESQKGLGAARKGTIMHFVMQNVNLERLAEAVKDDGENEGVNSLIREIESQVALMISNEQLTPAEAEVVRPEAIATFFGTSVGKRMLSAGTVHRETPFDIEIKCSELYKELSDEIFSDETMLLQGVIDCWFEDGDGLVLLDYKTDHVPAGRSDAIRERYKVQIEYYTKALEKITGKKVTEKYLYLFHTGELLNCAQ